MQHPTLAKFQIGKKGLTTQVIESLSSALKNHKQVRISVLKSACRNREELKSLAEEIVKGLQIVCKSRIIGYTIVLIKQNTKQKLARPVRHAMTKAHGNL